MNEKREFLRIPENISIKYRIISLGEIPEGYIDLRGAGTSENISEGGTLLESSELIPIGSFLEVEFHIPDVEYPVILRGRVVRVEEMLEGEKYEIGFQFTSYFKSDGDLLKKHLSFLTNQL